MMDANIAELFGIELFEVGPRISTFEELADLLSEDEGNGEVFFFIIERQVLFDYEDDGSKSVFVDSSKSLLGVQQLANIPLLRLIGLFRRRCLYRAEYSYRFKQHIWRLYQEMWKPVALLPPPPERRAQEVRR